MEGYRGNETKELKAKTVSWIRTPVIFVGGGRWFVSYVSLSIDWVNACLCRAKLHPVSLYVMRIISWVILFLFAGRWLHIITFFFFFYSLLQPFVEIRNKIMKHSGEDVIVKTFELTEMSWQIPHTVTVMFWVWSRPGKFPFHLSIH